MIDQSQTRQPACSVRRLVMEAHRAISQEAGKKGVRLLHRYADGTAPIVLDDAWNVGLVLNGLLAEVIRLTRSEVLYLFVTRDQEAGPQGAIRFDVLDEGAWISDQEARRIEESAGPTDDLGSDSAVTYRELARALGGDLVIKKIGEGTRCRLTIGFDARQERTPEAPPPYNVEKQRVLLVEDNEDHQHLIRAALNAVFPQVSLAEDGQQAIEMMEAARDEGRPFELVLMDVQLPKLDGRDATRRLRELGFDTPIVALTARTIDTELDACLLAGCSDYVTKPFNFADLRSSVTCHLAMASSAARDRQQA